MTPVTDLVVVRSHIWRYGNVGNGGSGDRLEGVRGEKGSE